MKNADYWPRAATVSSLTTDHSSCPVGTETPLWWSTAGRPAGGVHGVARQFRDGLWVRWGCLRCPLPSRLRAALGRRSVRVRSVACPCRAPCSACPRARTRVPRAVPGAGSVAAVTAAAAVGGVVAGRHTRQVHRREQDRSLRARAAPSPARTARRTGGPNRWPRPSTEVVPCRVPRAPEGLLAPDAVRAPIRTALVAHLFNGAPVSH